MVIGIIYWLTQDSLFRQIYHAEEGFWRFAFEHLSMGSTHNDPSIAPWTLYGPLVRWSFAVVALLPNNNLGQWAFQCIFAGLGIFSIYNLSLVIAEIAQAKSSQQPSQIRTLILAILLSMSAPTLACFASATPAVLVVCLSVLAVLSAIRFVEKNQTYWFVLFVVSANSLSLSHHWGFLLAAGLWVAVTICSNLNRRFRATIFAIGCLSFLVQFSIFGAWQFAVNGSYWSINYSPLKIISGFPIVSESFRTLPKFAIWVIQILLMARAAWVIWSKDSAMAAKLIAWSYVSFSTFLCCYSAVCKLGIGQEFLTAPLVLLAGLMLVELAAFSKVILTGWILYTAIGLVALRSEWINDDQKVLQFVAEQINEEVATGNTPVFVGSPVFFSLYPWLSENTKENYFAVLSGAGFYEDAYEGRKLIPSRRRIESSYFIGVETEFKRLTVVSQKVSQGFVVDTDSRWKSKTRSWFVSLRQPIIKIYVTSVSKPDG